MRNVWGNRESLLVEWQRWKKSPRPKSPNESVKNMKTRTTIAIVSASLLALGAVAWAADQNQSPTNDQSSAYNQTPPSNNYQSGTAYDYRGQYGPYYGCGWGGLVYQGSVSNQDAPGYAPQSFWHKCGHWFGWSKHPSNCGYTAAAYRGCRVGTTTSSPNVLAAQSGAVAYRGCCW